MIVKSNSRMRKLSSKTVWGVSAVVLTLTMMVILSPLTTALLFLQDAQSAPSTAAAAIVQPLDVEYNLGLVPKASRHLVFSFLDRTLGRPLYFFGCSNFVDKIETAAGWQNYLRDNDLHFNIPPITYRQPVSEHSSEG